MYYLYIVENKVGKHYFGYTSNLPKRIKEHNSSKGRWTKKKGHWHLVHQEEYLTKEKAFLRERQIKRYKSGEALRQLLAQ